MKTLFTTVALCAFALTSFSQNVIDRHFSAYQQNEDFTKVHVTGALFGLAAHIDNETNDPDVEEFKEFARQIKAFDLVASDKMLDSKFAFRDATRIIEKEFEELMSIDDAEGRFTFYIDERDGRVNEVVGVGAGPSSFVVFSLSGDMDLKQLSRMGQKLQGTGVEKLGELKRNSIDEIKVYPNPASVGGVVNIDLPESMIGGQLIVVDTQGRTVLQQATTARRLQLRDTLAKGQYIVQMQKDGVTIKRKLSVQ